MFQEHIEAHRPGGSIGAMMLALDITPSQAAEIWSGVPLRRAINRCLSCPTARECILWLRDSNHRKDEYRRFCPNAGFLDVASRR